MKLFKTTLYSNDLPMDSPRVFWDHLNNEYISNYDSDLAI